MAELVRVPLVLSQEGLLVQHMLSRFKTQGYSLPPGNLSYDGTPLCAVPISRPVGAALDTRTKDLPDHISVP